MFSKAIFYLLKNFLRRFQGWGPLLEKFNGEVAILGRNLSSPSEFLGRSDTYSRGGVKAGLYPLGLAREKYFYKKKFQMGHLRK